MSTPVAQAGNYTNLAASTLVATGNGAVLGIFVASSSSLTLKLWDNTAGSGAVIVNTFSAAAATYYELPFRFKTGLYVTIGGSGDFTVAWEQV